MLPTMTVDKAESVQVRMKLLEDELAGWKSLFEVRLSHSYVFAVLTALVVVIQEKHGRRPSREDMFCDPAAIELFEQFTSLRRRQW